jgi:hypothetical protein
LVTLRHFFSSKGLFLALELIRIIACRKAVASASILESDQDLCCSSLNAWIHFRHKAEIK